jgi:cell division protein FtsZ
MEMRQPAAAPAYDRYEAPQAPAYQPAVPQAPAYQAPAYQAPAYQQPAPQAPAYQAPTSFIPPQPEQPVRAPRMPRIEDLPLVAQQSYAASRGTAAPEPAPERKRASLIDRLAAAGFGRKTERAEPEAQAPRAPVQAPAEPRQSVDPMMGAPMAHQDFAKRPALQPQPQNQSRAFEDDQLEIPAFLRRQSN